MLAHGQRGKIEELEAVLQRLDQAAAPPRRVEKWPPAGECPEKTVETIEGPLVIACSGVVSPHDRAIHTFCR